MTDSKNNSITGVDKQALYGDYRNHQKRRDSLYMKAAHKALDIPDDDMDINATTDNSKHGIGALGAVAIAAVSGGIPLLALAAMWTAGAFDKPVDKPAPVITAPAEPKPSETKTEIKTNTKIYDWSVGEPIVE